ncbi:MAG: efflux RND transporter periplasmic adaptor subunit [Gallionella sp.]|nr:efflux RND transporter periplasmic adaptor subunit [Gallionella sp.]
MSRQNIKFLAIGLGSFAIFTWVVLTQGPLAPVKVTVEKIQIGKLSNEVFGIGTVKARRSYNLAPTMTSRVKSVLVDQGEVILAGQVLAEMDPVDLDDKLAGSQRVVEKTASAIQAAVAQVSEAQSRLKTLSVTATRYQQLRADGFASQEMFDAKLHEKNAAASALDTASANLAIARDEHARAQADARGIGKARAQTRLFSPINGVVAVRLAEAGSTVVGGQVVIQVVDPNSLWVETRIPQQQAGLVRVGQVAEVVLRSQAHTPVAGKVARIDMVSDAITEERIVNVSLSNANASIGEYAEVTLKLPDLNDARSISSAAVKRVDKVIGVWVLQKGEVVFKPVKIGFSTMDGRTQILDGLEEGDEVIVYSQQAMREGLKVKAVSALVKG